mgnify:FL=1|tara:strand:+ start:704 stop:1366 length:663 start_codon:yes stop_codon:yes gene_type:complete
MKIKLFVISVILVLIFLQFRVINQVNNKFEILQAENPNKDQFEKIVGNSYPAIFTNVSENFFDLQKYSLDSINKIETESRKNLNTNLKKHFDYYAVPMKAKTDMAINLEGAGTTDYIVKQSNYRLLICQLKGVKKIILFTPNQSKYLYLDKTGTKSQISFWTDDLLQYPLLEKTQYVEVVLYPGQMIYIPYQWYWASVNEEDSFTVYHKSESFFSRFICN